MAEQKTCFIIMPITTPESVVDQYRDGEFHFEHVLDCLFIPSVEKAGYSAIPPTAKGADLIQAEIIKNLETSDLVLCDMSCLNPNVFFEFGIRTSLNKPVCVVKDELTRRVPFDTGILNYHQCSSSLGGWELSDEVGKLAKHILDSAERSKGKNTLWRYFGLKSEARPYTSESKEDDKIDYLVMQVESLKQKVDAVQARAVTSAKDLPQMEKIAKAVSYLLRRKDPGFSNVVSEGDAVVAWHMEGFPDEILSQCREYVRKKWGVPVHFRPAIW